MPFDTFDCSIISRYLTSVSLVKDCDVISESLIRIATVFKHSNGSFIDLFLKSDEGLMDGWVLTDLGETSAYLLDMQVRIWGSEKRKRAVSDICEMLNVHQSGGQFAIRIERLEGLPEAMVRLSQACIRVSDLALTQRFRMSSVFKEDVEEFLAESDLSYTPDRTIEGSLGKQVSIDFEVQGAHTKTLILTLSTSNAASAHPLSLEVFRKWFDISNHKSEYNFLTIFDSSNNIIKEEDLMRISNFSAALSFPAENDSIRLALAA